MIAVALVAVVVVGMLQVVKMQKQISELDRTLSTNLFALERTVGDEVSALNRVIEDDRREVNLRIDNLNSYVDSRFDKMENKFSGNIAKKQVLND